MGGTVTNVLEMAAAMLTGDNGTFSVGDAQDYGCAGRGNFEPFKATYGHQVDVVDKQFYQWKKCVQCAMGTSWAEIPNMSTMPTTTAAQTQKQLAGLYVNAIVILLRLLPHYLQMQITLDMIQIIVFVALREM